MSQQAEFATPEKHIAELHNRLKSIEPVLLLLYRATGHQAYTAVMAQRAYQLARK